VHRGYDVSREIAKAVYFILRLSCTADSFSLLSTSSLDSSRSIGALDGQGVSGISTWLSWLSDGRRRFFGGLPLSPSTSVRSQRSRMVRFVERGVRGDDWSEERLGRGVVGYDPEVVVQQGWASSGPRYQ
jgi:hypothetical protein